MEVNSFCSEVKFNYDKRDMSYKNYSDKVNIRISCVTIRNFKCVDYGKIDFINPKTSEYYPINANILGLYGQNGSGKSALVDALSILKYILSGNEIPKFYEECLRTCTNGNGNVIAIPADLSYTFDISYDDKSHQTVVYEVQLKSNRKGDRIEKMDLTASEIKKEEEYKNSKSGLVRGFAGLQGTICEDIIIASEKLMFSGDLGGKTYKNKITVMETKFGSAVPFGPTRKYNEFIKNISGERSDNISNLVDLRTTIVQTFIFNQKVLNFLDNKEDTCDILPTANQQLIDVINLVAYYGNYMLCVADNRILSDSAVEKISIFSFHKRWNLRVDGYPTTLSEMDLEELRCELKKINCILNLVIPGLSITAEIEREAELDFEDVLTYDLLDKDEGYLADFFFDDGFKHYDVKLYSHRNGRDIPFSKESDGIKKIISVMLLYIATFRYHVTAVVDEFDAGIFEYLIGELLSVLQEDGVGQFIFTSHNLRPLEILKRQFICFTTVPEKDEKNNPLNQYYRLKYIGKCNNLRDVYFREINIQEQGRILYDKTDRRDVVIALRGEVVK